MNFKEYSIIRKKGKKEIILSVFLYISATILGLFSMLFLLGIGLSQIAALALFGFYYLAYRLSSGMNKEFEYAFVDDQITVDVIKNRKHRKRVLKFSMSEAEIIASAEDASNAHFLKKKYDKVIDATSGSTIATVYFAVINKEKHTLLKFEPTRSALLDLYKLAPSKVKISE